MKIKLLAATLLFFSLSGRAQQNSAFEKATGKWFAAWTLLSNDVFGINDVQDVDFVFFDSVNIY